MARRETEVHQVLSTTTILVWSAGLLCVAGFAVALLWTTLGTGETRDSIRLDVIRTAASIVVGTGGAAALLLAARRQRATELDVKQKDHDATERRVTELYGKAADQLGSDKAAVRLAGLYALERLAQGNPAHRQTIVNLVCAYLRMPARPSAPAASAPPRMRSVHRAEEWEVRQAAQRLLTRHLRPEDETSHWPGIELDLSGANLEKFTLTHCVCKSALFIGTTFVGPATFRGATVEETADFRDARFLGLADFRRVTFDTREKPFRGARFEGQVEFGTTTPAVLAGALTRTDKEVRRVWPRGWSEREIPDERPWARLVSEEVATDPR
ncbi:pentapeptide repeat-containing protein [Amycolatopsis anabasis]|uniref:pentapeptide repeat-containing protein n=1 Tax=Amycolatopsis anabasis TaxID=1840409 RepID=UPI00131BCF49|nr:pentapeptide repeat-containing protein [Amycolatopsis anabasis]